MKLVEFKCNKCNNIFEELVRDEEKVTCPKCYSSDVKRLISSFATFGSKGGKGSSSTCTSSRGFS